METLDFGNGMKMIAWDVGGRDKVGVYVPWVSFLCALITICAPALDSAAVAPLHAVGQLPGLCHRQVKKKVRKRKKRKSEEKERTTG